MCVCVCVSSWPSKWIYSSQRGCVFSTDTIVLLPLLLHTKVFLHPSASFSTSFSRLPSPSLLLPPLFIFNLFIIGSSLSSSRRPLIFSFLIFGLPVLICSVSSPSVAPIPPRWIINLRGLYSSHTANARRAAPNDTIDYPILSRPDT